MRSLLAFIGLVVTTASIALVEDNQSIAQVQEEVQSTVTESPDGTTEEITSTFIRLPTVAGHIDEELQQQIDEMTQRMDQEAQLQSQINEASIQRIQALETQLATLTNTVPQIGRVEAIETTLEEIQERLDTIENPPEPIVQESAEQSQCLLLFTATNCDPCEYAKAEVVPWLRDAGWNVEVYPPNAAEQSQYNVNGPYPLWVALSYGEEVDRWLGADKDLINSELRENYETRSEQQGTAVTYSAPAETHSNDLAAWIHSNSDAGDWTYPGSIRSHLIEHGWSDSDLAGLSTSEMVELHDATHEGRISPSGARSASTSSSRSYTSSYSSCPGGVCPSPRRQALRGHRRGMFVRF